MNFNNPQEVEQVDRREYLRRWHLKHRERRLLERRARYQAKRDIELKKCSEYQKLHREAARKSCKKWREKNKPYLAARQHKYRAARYAHLKSAAAENLKSIVAWVKEARARKRFTCYYCQHDFPVSQLHFDHIIPLSKGGAHSIENLCKSCAHCNITKSSKPVRVWVTTGQQLLEL